MIDTAMGGNRIDQLVNLKLFSRAQFIVSVRCRVHA
jgi:hypothetical protein